MTDRNDIAAAAERVAELEFPSSPSRAKRATALQALAAVILAAARAEARREVANVSEAKPAATRCDECDPSFGCFDGSAACSKRPPAASLADRAKEAAEASAPAASVSRLGLRGGALRAARQWQSHLLEPEQSTMLRALQDAEIYDVDELRPMMRAAIALVEKTRPAPHYEPQDRSDAPHMAALRDAVDGLSPAARALADEPEAREK